MTLPASSRRNLPPPPPPTSGSGTALRRAYAHRVDRRPRLARRQQRLGQASLVVLAVRHHHDDAVFRRRLRERLDAHRDRPGQIRPLRRHRLRIHRAQEHHGRPVVPRQRALHEGVAREGHQPDPVAVEALDDPADLDLGAFEAVGRDVLGVHGAGDVERDDDVLTLAPHRLDAGAELRPRQGEGQQGDRHEQEGGLPAARAGAGGGTEPAHEVVFAEPFQQRPAAAAGVPVQHQEQRDQGQGPERGAVAEAEHATATSSARCGRVRARPGAAPDPTGAGRGSARRSS